MAGCTMGQDYMFVQQLRCIGSGAMEETGILVVHSAGLHHQHL